MQKIFINHILNVRHSSQGLGIKCWAKQVSYFSPTFLILSHITPKVYSPTQFNDSLVSGNMIIKSLFLLFLLTKNHSLSSLCLFWAHSLFLICSRIWPDQSACKYCFLPLNFLKDFYLFIFRQRGRVGERKGEKYQCVVAPHTPPTRDLACNPGMCPDWDSNQRPFALQSGAQSTEPHKPGLLPLNFYYTHCP